MAWLKRVNREAEITFWQSRPAAGNLATPDFTSGFIVIFATEILSKKTMEATGNTSRKTDAALVSQLESGVESHVLEAIAQLRESGTPAYLPVLGETLLATTFPEVRKRLLALFGELKSVAAVPFLAGLLSDVRFVAFRKELAGACWQNGLDFSPHLPLFVDLVIENEIEIAFEAFTVIENLDHFPAPEICEKEVVKIDRALQTAEGNKVYLLQELRGIIA